MLGIADAVVLRLLGTQTTFTRSSSARSCPIEVPATNAFAMHEAGYRISEFFRHVLV